MNHFRRLGRRFGEFRKCSAGFSLVELMITLVISAFLIGALVLTYVSGRTAAADAEQLARVQENIRIIAEYLVRDIRNSGYVDEVELLVGQDALMRSEFLEIDPTFSPPDMNGTGPVNALRVRYAGRGHCGEIFLNYVLVENAYWVDTEGVLRCTGRHVPGNFAPLVGQGWDDVGVLTNPNTVPLLSGIDSIGFGPLGQTGCVFRYDEANIGSSCTGVEINIGLVGPRGDIRELSLVSAFRNVILERMSNNIPAPAGS